MSKIEKEATRVNTPKPEELGNFEDEDNIRRLGEERILKLDSEGQFLEKDGSRMAEDFNKVIGLLGAKFESLKEKFGLNNKLKKISERAAALAEEAKAKIIEIMKTEEFSQIVDATPFVGGAKRVAESFAGKTLSGEALSGTQRLKHGTEGAVNIGTDFEGIGEVKKGAKLAHIGKKIAGGIKSNPEVLKNLGKKIITRKKEKND